MIILGIDPGSRRIGYGVLKNHNNKLSLLTTGILPISSAPQQNTLPEIRLHLSSLIDSFHPTRVAIEKIFFTKNQKTVINVAQARGVILETCLERRIEIYEYTPSEVKAAVTGYGRADKKAVLKMVRLILCEPRLTVIDDASDALALAIAASRSFKNASP